MEWLPVLAHEIDVTARTARSASAADLERSVAGCPGWTVRDLVVHVGSIERWVVHAVREQELLRAEPSWPGTDLPSWYEEGAADLLLALDTDPAAPAATFAPDKTVAAGSAARFMSIGPTAGTSSGHWDKPNPSTRCLPTTASTRSPRCSGLGRYGSGAR